MRFVFIGEVENCIDQLIYHNQYILLFYVMEFYQP